MVGRLGRQRVGYQRIRHVRIAFYRRDALFIGQLHGRESIRRHAAQQLVDRAFSVIMQARANNKFRHNVSPYCFFACAAKISV